MEREARVSDEWSKEKVAADLPRRRWSLEEERIGEREEKNSLNVKREDESEEKDNRVWAEVRIVERYGLGFWR